VVFAVELGQELVLRCHVAEDRRLPGLSGLLVNEGCRSAEPVAELLVALESILVAAVRIPTRKIELIGSVVIRGRIGERVVRCEFQSDGI
jgi:hypothetical protein